MTYPMQDVPQQEDGEGGAIGARDEATGIARDRQALQARRAGQTYREIGDALGVSRERARQIVARGERRCAELLDQAWLPLLPGRQQQDTRIVNALKGAGFASLDPVASMGWGDVVGLKGIGRASAARLFRAVGRDKEIPVAALKSPGGEEIPLAHLHVVNVRPGDILVLRHPGVLSAEARDRLVLQLGNAVGSSGIQAMVLVDGAELSVLRQIRAPEHQPSAPGRHQVPE